ncbi:MAG: 5-deoxy-glucuronate isomerase [Lachnospiraceae bacterium]|nr:5-deoxy-glucuronate isomerase [Lachnospiraceae bacterium]
MAKVFGYPVFDENGEKILTTYDNEYSAMNMDIRVYEMKPGTIRRFLRVGEETAVLLLSGRVTYAWEKEKQTVSRMDVFTEGPWCLHVPAGIEITVRAEGESQILVQCTKNEKMFAARLHRPEDAPWGYSSVGKFGNVAKRRVNTIFDHDIEPASNMVLGEVLNDRGNWSGYLPHRHPQPETYYFLFDRPEGFGASFVGNQVFKSVDGSFSAIPGGELHPQAVAPGFQMYTCWMIRHIDGNPWLQTDRCEDERYVWMHEAQFGDCD